MWNICAPAGKFQIISLDYYNSYCTFILQLFYNNISCHLERNYYLTDQTRISGLLEDNVKGHVDLLHLLLIYFFSLIAFCTGMKLTHS